MSNQLFELTSFQRDLLVVAAGLNRPSGQTIRAEMEETYNTEITHGRLYPNLDTLAEKGLITKGTVDRRTNSYEVSDNGLSALHDYREWANEHADQLATA